MKMTETMAAPDSFAELLPQTIFKQLTLPIIIVFGCYLSFGFAIAMLPLYVKVNLGFKSSVVAEVIAIQYIATLLSRGLAGNIADRIGAKPVVIVGILAAVCCGLIYVCCSTTTNADIQLSFLMLGRVLSGIAESMVVVGILSLATSYIGSEYVGKIMTWNGNAMYGGVAVGALIGGWLYSAKGFLITSCIIIILPLIVLPMVLSLKKLLPIEGLRLPFYKVIGRVILPGMGLALSTVGYGVILSFVSLLFQSRHWIGAEVSITCFGMAYVLVRFFFSSLVEYLGNMKLALFSLLVECIGQIIIFLATQKFIIFFGAFLTGAGFSLVVPALGIEAVKRVSSQNRSAAMGAYLAFFDLAFIILIPVAGVVTNLTDYSFVYGIGAFCAFIGYLFIWNYSKKSKINQ